MNILTSPLPDCIIWKGKAYKLNTDFRIWLKFEGIMQDSSLSAAEKTRIIRDICFAEPPPDGAALEALNDFYMCGHTQKGKDAGKNKPIVSFEQDAEYIYAAFYSQYGIDLAQSNLHWYKFHALFTGLGEENMIVKIMHFRGMDISRIKDKNQKAFYRKMKRIYRIKGENISAGEMLESLFNGGGDDK